MCMALVPDEDEIKKVVTKEKTKMVRCKFRCHYKEEMKRKDTGEVEFVNIKLSPVTNGSEENKLFYKYTPYGDFALMTINVEAAKQIVEGKEYYIDISEA